MTSLCLLGYPAVYLYLSAVLEGSQSVREVKG